MYPVEAKDGQHPVTGRVLQVTTEVQHKSPRRSPSLDTVSSELERNGQKTSELIPYPVTATAQHRQVQARPLSLDTVSSENQNTAQARAVLGLSLDTLSSDGNSAAPASGDIITVGRVAHADQSSWELAEADGAPMASTHSLTHTTEIDPWSLRAAYELAGQLAEGGWRPVLPADAEATGVSGGYAQVQRATALTGRPGGVERFYG